MAQHEIVDALSSIFSELNVLKMRLRAIDAKYDELQLDCSTMVTAMRTVLATDSTDSNQLSQVFLMTETFPVKHLTRRDDSDCRALGWEGTAEVNN